MRKKMQTVMEMPKCLYVQKLVFFLSCKEHMLSAEPSRNMQHISASGSSGMSLLRYICISLLKKLQRPTL